MIQNKAKLLHIHLLFAIKNIYVEKTCTPFKGFSLQTPQNPSDTASTSRKIMSHFGDDNSSVEEVSSAEESYNTEFRSYPDDAWYSVRVSLEGERGDKLRVKYENFPEEHDNVFLAEGFKSEDELYDFIGRFRKVSAQLQDRDCYQMVRGMRVCASDSLGDDDNLFYDAIVDEVVHKKHSNVNGQEECECTFLLFWLHGPNVGNVVEKGVANICLLQSAELEPKLATFMEIATQKIEKALCKLGSDTIDDVAFNPVFRHEANGSPIVKQKLSSIGRSRQGKCSQRSLSKVWPSEAVIGEKILNSCLVFWTILITLLCPQMGDHGWPLKKCQ
ncbi:PREDICTED: uncharacterized protein LOC108662795 isoform X5 [Theobroma cacao]|uniref:Uncharacterized protein LOC108662795 isoform X5 n=1 Tax=Theobroma cacao TaxID=3641 RepID=A0AB32WQG8_THECC|nr:PREDICTED: uncharacterized protein LOC108662795 isoform X5 [Theobroma cacao]